MQNQPASLEPHPCEDDLRFLTTNKTFLGREFLTWLWFYTDKNGGEIEIEGLGVFHLNIDDRIKLSSSGGCAHEQALKGGTPASAEEAFVALRSGKMVQEAKFLLKEGERQWMWTMRADDLSPRQLKLPAIADPDPQHYMTQRIRLTQEVVEVIQSLFRRYLNLRLTNNHMAEINKIRTWGGMTSLDKNSQIHAQPGT